MGFFIKQASEQYRNLPQVDKTRLASISTGFEGVKQKQSVSKQASRIFKIVHNKVFVNMDFCDFFVLCTNKITDSIIHPRWYRQTLWLID